jgi:hypothetical protein
MSEWITDRLPTAEDADGDGFVRIMTRRGSHPTNGHFAKYDCIVPGQPWWSERVPRVPRVPRAARAAQQTPPPAPAPARVVTAMTYANNVLYAACNDGTVWARRLAGDWLQADSIPQPEAPNA